VFWLAWLDSAVHWGHFWPVLDAGEVAERLNATPSEFLPFSVGSVFKRLKFKHFRALLGANYLSLSTVYTRI
jgi:hypothetical protein